jgi:pimeloyl-ACP methyl ester carboxylesterase
VPSFQRHGHEIAYEIHGTGVPVVLLHGVTVSYAGNYGAWGWTERLNRLGYQVIGMDFRGHGKSAKPRVPGAYGTDSLSGDVMALIDQLGHSSVSLIGYSLGSAIALNLRHRHPHRFGPSVLIATGDGLLGHPPFTASAVLARLGAALAREEFPDDLPSHESAYWTFAVKVGGDRLAALAAVQAHYPSCDHCQAQSITAPVLVVSGELDPVLGRGPRLAQAIPGATYVEVLGADHFALSRAEGAISAVDGFLAMHKTRDRRESPGRA